MNTTKVLGQIMALAPPLEPVQFVVEADGTEEAVWIDARTKELVVRTERAESAATIRIDKASFIKAVDGTQMLNHALEQLFAAKKISVDGKIVLFHRFMDCARQWQCPPRPRRGAQAALPSKPVTPSVHLDAIERRADVPNDEFQRVYLGPQRPVILTKATSAWPLMKLSIAEIGQRLAPFQGYARASYGEDEGKNVAVPFEAYLATFEAASNGETPAYLGNNPFPEALYDLIDFPYLSRAAFAAPRLWIGPAGTVTPLHRDPTDNFFVQVVGTKRFVIAAPDEAPHVYCATSSARGDFAQIDPEKPDLERFPLSAKAHLLTFEVHAGEMLFLPAKWFHHVRSLRPSISINMWTMV